MMPSFRPLTRAVAVKELTLLRRYPVNSLSQLVTIYLYFVILFFGGQTFLGPTILESFDGIIVGFFLWTIASLAFGYLAWTITLESQWGTLEQLYMSPYGFGRVMLVRAAVSLLLNFGWGVLMLILMLLTSGRPLALDIDTVLVIGLLTILPAVGIGFLVAGLALLYKRIESFIQLMSIGFIGLIAAPVSSYPVLRILPLTQGSYLLRRTMQQNIEVWQLPPSDLAVLVAVAAFYLGGGTTCLYEHSGGLVDRGCSATTKCGTQDHCSADQDQGCGSSGYSQLGA
ncbi:ABC transporter permease [Salinigranum rubrum]|uniref:ABC transporter permease n=1 Tax=Salinigranum rubrum TaxID=755307 RepID=UPI001FE261D1|nr:ABC transporter permease [Salinigranum rubrum]